MIAGTGGKGKIDLEVSLDTGIPTRILGGKVVGEDVEGIVVWTWRCVGERALSADHPVADCEDEVVVRFGASRDPTLIPAEFFAEVGQEIRRHRASARARRRRDAEEDGAE